MQEYLNSIENENENYKSVARTQIKRISKTMIKHDIKDVRHFTESNFESLITEEYYGLSEKTLKNSLTRLREIFKFYNNKLYSKIDITYIRGILSNYNPEERKPKLEEKVDKKEEIKEESLEAVEGLGDEFLKTMKTENTRTQMLMIIKKLKLYLAENDLIFEEMQKEDVDLFMMKNFTDKSETTISTVISRLKAMFRFYKMEKPVVHLSLMHFREIAKLKDDIYYSPFEIYEMIRQLKNYQDKVLVLFFYMGLYDEGFKTIRELKVVDFDPVAKTLMVKGEEMGLNSFCAEIIEEAIDEERMFKYTSTEYENIQLNTSSTYLLNTESPYILRTKQRAGGKEILPIATIKKKFEKFSSFLGKELSPIIIKNSRVLYDLVKFEFDNNDTLDVNQVALADFLDESNVKGNIGRLNMAKKKIKLNIIKDILENKNLFIEQERK